MTMYKLEILKPAQRELEEIAAVYLSLVGPSAARNITDKIFATLERLCNFPHIGILSRDKYLKEAGYRIAVSGDYLCLYRLINDTLFVYHIVHGATDYPKLFKELKDMSGPTSAT